MIIQNITIWTVTALAVAVIVLFPLQPACAEEPENKTHVVEIRNLQFSPAELVVSPGNTITWINYDLIPHTVTGSDKSWDSGLIGSKQQWKTTVSKGMIENYYCQYHPSMTASLKIVSK